MRIIYENTLHIAKYGTFPVLLKTIKIIKSKEGLRNWHNPEEPEKT